MLPRVMGVHLNYSVSLYRNGVLGFWGIAGATVWFGVFGEIFPRRFFMLFRSKIVTFNINYAETHQRLRLGDWALSHEKSWI